MLRLGDARFEPFHHSRVPPNLAKVTRSYHQPHVFQSGIEIDYDVLHEPNLECITNPAMAFLEHKLAQPEFGGLTMEEVHQLASLVRVAPSPDATHPPLE
ncbi:uncharacterized protein LTR77_006114 [Saxophila tyrrhenica]|uniref:Uncharacterized protein n=1 Tax=Saxophila tyrrhenica TaxID=1690608 RepID=A0AAV9PB89_9PEZI|nr:hypothetical protein LTR77_006114 [Saxophila tyrrhenica]